MELTLYYAPLTCALVPFVTLTEAGADFEVCDLNTRANQHRTPEFLAVNPKHKVPVLLIDGEPLTENVAIQLFIARTFPDARLLPADSRAELKAISLMAWFASTIHPHLTPNARPENYCDLPGSAENVKRVAMKLLFEDFAIADKLLAGTRVAVRSFHRARRLFLLVLPARAFVQSRPFHVRQLPRTFRSHAAAVERAEGACPRETGAGGFCKSGMKVRSVGAMA